MREAIIRLHREGLGSTRIARALGCSRDVVRSATRDLPKHRQCRGENHYAAKLTEKKVREIRRSREKEPAIAARLGVTVSAVHDVRRGRTWKWVG